MSNYTRKQIAGCIDHAVLKPTATRADLLAGIETARRWQVASLCVRPCDVAETARLLADSGVMVGTVIGFPHGTTSTAGKVAEAKTALADGAEELDMVLNLGRLKDGDAEALQEDIAAVVQAANGICVKVILECSELTDAEKRLACECAVEAGAAFVKTSTGFASGGATVADVKLMRQVVGDRAKVKASGGIRSLADAVSLLDAGADRLGTSSTDAILTELQTS